MISDFLKEEGFNVKTFCEVEAEPHIETAEKIYEIGRIYNVSVIVGIGGGSVMDMSKLAAQSFGNKVEPRMFGDRKMEPNNSAVPLILLPTTSGTGSEVSVYFVVAYGEEKRFFLNQSLLPDIAMIDPVLTVSMPPWVTATTGIDALTHAAEAVMNKKSSAMSDIIGLGAIELIAKNLRKAVYNGEDIEARYNMAVGSAMAMIAFNMCGGLWAHSVSYILPFVKGLPHGLGCSLALPFLIDYNLQVIPDQIAKMAKSMQGAGSTDSTIQAAKKAVHLTAELITDIGLPLTIKEFGVESNMLEELALKMMKMYPRPLNPRTMNQKEAVAFWEAMYNGTLR
jgi:alcohol dehydrogenase